MLDEKLLEILIRLHKKQHKGFGNARTMRNLFEKISFRFLFLIILKLQLEIIRLIHLKLHQLKLILIQLIMQTNTYRHYPFTVLIYY